jgi:hypothetical protein
MKRLLVFLLVVCAVPAIAQVPSGAFSYVFTNTPLWDTTGSYTDTNVANTVVTMAQQLSAKGVITGTLTETYYVSSANNFDAIGPIAGKASVKSGVAGGSWTESGTMTGVNGGVAYTGTYTGKGTATIDPTALTMLVTGPIKECINRRCETTAGSETYTLPAGMTGDWALDTDITAAAKKLSGTGTLTLSNDRAFTYQITGSYNTRSGVAKLKLVGQGDAVGTSLSLTTHGTNMVLTTLKGKLLGQKPTYP